MAGIRRITNDKLVRPGQRVGVTTYIELVSVAVAHEGVRQPITGSKRCPPPFGDVEATSGLRTSSACISLAGGGPHVRTHPGNDLTHRGSRRKDLGNAHLR